MATGTNNVDLEAAREREIVVCNARGYATNSVAQHTIGLMLNLATQQHRYIADTGANRWQESDVFCRLDYPIIELAGKTLGIIGLGELGSAVAKLGQALGMTVLALRSENAAESAEVTRVSMEILLDKADFLSLHCPLTEANTGLVDESFLEQMKPSAFLINTARGGLIQTDALLNALDQGLIRGAAIDVLTKEPAAPDEPLLARPRPNLIVTPHNAWGASESRARLIDQLCENLGAWQAGAPIRWVNP
jgi:glycerate dehydrogenase